MIQQNRLDEILTRLKLITIRDRLDNFLDEIARKDMDYKQALEYLLENEISSKNIKRVEMAVRLAKFPYYRTLDHFEFDAQPSINPTEIRELATCRWVGNGDAVLLMGPPGVGKTHLSVGLGHCAIKHGYSVLFITAINLLTQLAKAQSDGCLEERLIYFSKPKLLIIDELGYLPLEVNAAHLFFQLISRRYERGSVLITSNRPVIEWGEVFGDSVVATAILDRLLHHSHVVTIKGESYRLKEKKRSGLIKGHNLMGETNQ